MKNGPTFSTSRNPLEMRILVISIKNGGEIEKKHVQQHVD